MKTLDYRSIERLPGNGKPGPRGILLTTSDGAPMPGNDGAQAEIWLKKFLLQQTGNPKFIERLEGIDATEMQLSIRKAIDEQIEIDDGLVVLEDDHAKRLAEAILRPQGGYVAHLSHNLYPLMLPAKKMVDGDLRKKLAEDSKAQPEAAEAPAN